MEVIILKQPPPYFLIPYFLFLIPYSLFLRFPTFTIYGKTTDVLWYLSRTG